MNKIYLFFIGLCLSTFVSAKLIKISNTGEPLPNSAKAWNCVIDDKTQLMWEVKLKTEGLQNVENTYTWFDGHLGVEDGEYSRHCHWGKVCNTRAFIQALNLDGLCQSSTWRLPDEAELSSLLVYQDNDPLINGDYFPNTLAKSYWTSTLDANNLDVAIDVPFFYGGTKGSEQSFDSYVRGVSSVK